jgi:hypothetical protein
MTQPSEYVLELLRKSADFTLYRGRRHGNPSPAVALALAAEQPSPQGLRRLEHEFSSRRSLVGSDILSRDGASAIGGPVIVRNKACEADSEPAQDSTDDLRP